MANGPEDSILELNQNMIEIGSKQMLIDQLRTFQANFNEILAKLKCLEQTIELYLDATKQFCLHETDNILIKEYMELQNQRLKIIKNKSINVKFKINKINDHIHDFRNTHNLTKCEEIFAEQKRLFENFTRDIRSILEEKPIFIKSYLQNIPYYDPNRRNGLRICNNFEDILKIIVIGKRGAGKSSFINSIRNIDEFDEDNEMAHLAAKTDAVECTQLMHFYHFESKVFLAEDLENSQSEKNIQPNELAGNQSQEGIKSPSGQRKNIYLIDFPGVGTERFPSEDYVDILANMEADAFIYLFQNDLEEIDYKIICKITSTIKVKIFLVKNKIDTDFEGWIEAHNLCLNNHENNFEEIKHLAEENWPVFRKDLENRFIKILQMNRIKLDEKCYFISSSSDYRNFFDFDILVRDIIYFLPPEKANRLKVALKKVFKTWDALKKLL